MSDHQQQQHEVPHRASKRRKVIDLTASDDDEDTPPIIQTTSSSTPANNLASWTRDISPPPQSSTTAAAAAVQKKAPPASMQMSAASLRAYEAAAKRASSGSSVQRAGATIGLQIATTTSGEAISLRTAGHGLAANNVTTSSLATSSLATSASSTGQKKKNRSSSNNQTTTAVPSPFHLTRIRDLGAAENVDAVGLKDILGDPLIKECWNFNFLFDVDFMMAAVDADVRSLVRMKIVHGSWRREDGNRMRIEAGAAQYANIEVIQAYMPEAFGTHHSKMMILLRHDDTAQVIIHTANMVAQDWTNLTNAVWQSPLLPLRSSSSSQENSDGAGDYPIGSGARFKTDLLRYLNAYGSRLRPLTTHLKKYDFASIRAALVASTPTRQSVSLAKPESATSWGWLGLKEVLSQVPCSRQSSTKSASPHIVVQISSIATLGGTDKWLTSFFSTLSSTSDSTKKQSPKFNVIFPTAAEIRSSLDGYASGGSIHTKIASTAQQKQLAYLKPYLCHWDATCGSGSSSSQPSHSSAATTTARTTASSSKNITTGTKALRNKAAPHIKTYIRYSDTTHSHIDWAFVTSANISTQAWGALPSAGKSAKKDDEIRICSWEIGVVCWPDLWKNHEADEDTKMNSKSAHPQEEVEVGVEMVPVFGKDTAEDVEVDDTKTTLMEKGDTNEGGDDGHTRRGDGKARKRRIVVGLRMPYDLPLVPYAASDVPWCASDTHSTPDWMGRTWQNH